jgi:ATP-dependent RNA circularization protein (DNA/RNA ligase family)
MTLSAKYPRMPHLPWSPGIVSDDRVIRDVQPLLRARLVISEKLDGSNVCFTRDAIFARSHSGPPIHPSFDYAKALHSQVRCQIQEGTSVFGEYCFAVHSIRYEALPSYFFVFAIREDETGLWLPWHQVEVVAECLRLVTVPVLWQGTVSSEGELQEIMKKLMAGPSYYGPEREGVVVRKESGFPDFETSIAKAVRASHVQTNEHWLDRPVEKQALRSSDTT